MGQVAPYSGSSEYIPENECEAKLSDGVKTTCNGGSAHIGYSTESIEHDIHDTAEPIEHRNYAKILGAYAR